MVNGNIGERIQKIRLENHMSLSELAERASIAKSYLSNVERNIQSNPSIQLIEKIAEALGVSVNSLLYDDPSIADTELDPDWLRLVQDAMSAGISKSEFQQFLEFQKWKKTQQ